MSLTAYPTLRLKLTMPQALKLQFMPAVPGSNAAASAAAAQAAAAQAIAAANTAVAATANKVDKGGDTMSGFLTLNADPSSALQAATKQYVDAHAGSGGNVSTSGTITIGQYAKWATATTIQSAAPATVLSDIGAQPLDADLTSLAAATGTGTTGVYYRKAANTWAILNIGTGLSLDTGTDTLTATASSGGAPTTAEYITSSTDATLTNERVLTNTATVIWDFSTPGQAKATATGGPGGSLPPDGTYTDIAVNGTGTIWTIRPAVVTYSKIQNVSVTNRFLGRITAGAGSTEELTGANAKTIIGSGDLTKTDDTNVTLTLGGTPAAALYNAVSLTLGWTGTLSVARGGLGVGTITGLMQGNGTGAVTGITNSSTVGQVLRVTGVSTYAWGALDLTSANAITGDLPFSSLTQGSARSVLGVTANATADVASIQGTTDQVLRVNGAGTALAFGAIDLSKVAAATGILQAASFPTLTGDVTTAGGALATTIAASAVTYAKMQNTAAASVLLGRGSAAGAGALQEIALGTNLSMSGTTLNATGGGGSGFTVINIQTFSTAGAFTYTPTASMKYALIELVGGGGAAGSVAGTVQGGFGVGMAGGGSGAYSRKFVSAATVGASLTGTVGAAGAVSIGTTGNNGGAGGTTSIGTNLCAALGGSGGSGWLDGNNTNFAGGAGGQVTGSSFGDLKIPGNPGGNGISVTVGSGGTVYGGHGGASFFGGAGQAGVPAAATNSSAVGGAGSNGSGGGGPTSLGNTTNRSGGAGGAGYVVITEYI